MSRQQNSSPSRRGDKPGDKLGGTSGSPRGNEPAIVENKSGVVQLGNGPEGALLDQHQAIVSSTFANVELTNTKRTLQQYVDLYEAAKKENARLASEVQERDKDALQVVEFLRYDIEEKNTNLREAEQKLAKVKEEMQQKQAVEVEKWRDLVEQKDEQISKNKETIAGLHKELESVALFKREKQELFLEVGKHKEQHASTVNRYEKELTKLRFQALEDKVLLRAAEKDMVAKFNEEVDSRAMLLVNTKAKDIHKQNQQLQKDQRELTVEVGRITSENETMKQEVHEVRREAQLGRELQKEYARQGVKLGAQTKDASNKAKHLEDKLSTVVSSYEERLAQVQGDCARQVGELQKKLYASQNAEKVLRTELVRMKRLSQRIVSERSELETFFHEALEHVKSQQQLLQQQLPPSRSVSRSPRNTNLQSQGGASTKIPRLPSVEANLQQQQPQPQRNNLPATARSAPRVPGALPSSIITRGSSGEATVLTARATKRDTKMLLASADRERKATTTTSVPIQQVPVPEHRGELVPSREGGTGDPEDALPDFRATPSLNGGSVTPGAAGATQQQQQSNGVSFGSLSWDDKEKVIRALLHKINQSFYNTEQHGRQQQEQQAELRRQYQQQHCQQQYPMEKGNGVETFITDPALENHHHQQASEQQQPHDLGLQGPSYAGYEVVDEAMSQQQQGSAAAGAGGGNGGLGARPGTGDSIFGQQGPYRVSTIPSSAGSVHTNSAAVAGVHPQGVRYSLSLPTPGSSQSQRPQTRGTVVAPGSATPSTTGKKVPGSAGGMGKPGLPPHPPSASKATPSSSMLPMSHTLPPRAGSGSTKLRDGLNAINRQPEDVPGGTSSSATVNDPSVE